MGFRFENEENRKLDIVYQVRAYFNLSYRIYICYLPARRSVLGKTVLEVLGTARGRRPRAVLKTEGRVFPNTDRPRPANNVFIFFCGK